MLLSALLSLSGCATTLTYVNRSMADPAPGGSSGEFYILISEQECSETSYGGWGGTVTTCASQKARLLRCQETGSSGDYTTRCHTALTSDYAFSVAEKDYARGSSVRTAPRADLACATILGMVHEGASEQALLNEVKGAATIYNDEVDCIVSAGIPASVQAAVKAKAEPRP